MSHRGEALSSHAVCGPSPEFQYNLWLRVYAPFKHFAGYFHGDNRGPSVSENATARLAGRISFNLLTGTVSKHAPIITSHHPLLSPFARYTGNLFSSENSLTEMLLYAHQPVAGHMWFLAHFANANPLVPFLPTPDIDAHIRGTITLTDDCLAFELALEGDGFPNLEVFVEDPRGQRVMLFTRDTPHGTLGPYTQLFTDRKLPLGALCTYVSVDDNGHFQP